MPAASEVAAGGQKDADQVPHSFSWRDTDAATNDATYRVIAVTADGQQGPPNEAVGSIPVVATDPAVTRQD